jgi:hypothetical protein
MTPCVCPLAGHCPTHRRPSDPPEGRVMSKVLHKNCRTKPGHYEAFQIDRQRAEAKPELAEPQPSRGLGDTIKKISDATGVSALASLYEKVTGKPCGCGKRQAWLNEKVPYSGTMTISPGSSPYSNTTGGGNVSSV